MQLTHPHLFKEFSKKFAELAKSMNSPSRHPLAFYPNPGNWGDGLILAGTRIFLKRYDIRYVEIGFNETPSPNQYKRAVVGGGGAWCSLWSTGFDLAVRALETHESVIVLPSTFALPITHSSHVELWARDESLSLSFVPHARFCHDMAFQLLNTREVLNAGTAIYESGDFFREDAESRIGSTSQSNNDLSLKHDFRFPISAFFKEVALFRHIHTDRLHVAIAGALLDRHVWLYQGAYPKNQAAFAASLSYFPKVTFVEDSSRP